MKRENNPNSIMRCELLKTCLEKGMPTSQILKIVQPMKGKSERDKEKMADEILKTI